MGARTTVELLGWQSKRLHVLVVQQTWIVADDLHLIDRSFESNELK
jgi:hypothetical protein